VRDPIQGEIVERVLFVDQRFCAGLGLGSISFAAAWFVALHCRATMELCNMPRSRAS